MICPKCDLFAKISKTPSRVSLLAKLTYLSVCEFSGN